MLLWEPISRSPLTVLLSFLCFFANSLLDGVTQTTSKVYFGCFSTAALLIGTALERRFLSDRTEELDSLAVAPGLISVVGAGIEYATIDILRKPIHYIIIIVSFFLAMTLAIEYYNDGDLSACWKWFTRRRKKRKYHKSASYTTSTSTLKRRRWIHSEGSFVFKYELGKKLGSGFFGTVLLAMDKSKDIHTENQSRLFAAKCINRSKLSVENELQIRNEVTVLTEIRNKHPYIVNLFDFFDEPSNFYIVLELMRGGELFHRIFKKEKYFEKDARVVVRTIAKALSFLHGLDIVHRDLKPENILMESEGSNSRIKLADFGFARKVEKGCTTACGTPNYVAPEIINGSVYGTSVDVWALGVITYILLSGFSPFYEQNRPKLFKQIRSGEFSFPDPYFSFVSFQAQDFIRKCLTVNVTQRINADEILEHPWIIGPSISQRKLKTFQTSEKLDTDNGNAEGAPELKAAQGLIKLFNARTRLRAGILAAIAANRMSEIVEVVKGKKPKGDLHCGHVTG